MKHHFLLITLLGQLLLPIATAGTLLEGRVVSVHDGDTLTVLTPEHRQIKIRLAQIDAPETSQDFGQRSKQSLSDLAYGKNVRIDAEATDKYGRTVGKVLVDGLDANLEQVKLGMAWVYRQYAKDSAYFTAEDAAKSSKAGLWSQPNPIPPWEYRHGSQKGNAVVIEPHTKTENVRSSVNSPLDPTADSVQCGIKRLCKEMSSCAEAKFYMNQCGLSRLDRDGDGVPCEALCPN
ncbi:thermonuclease family protein [Methylogaea oryzae]|uniref:TNase-like domain-containing protein n=1 Tax=Methylogaea oryzae TaxID=1295382 RepID=A0A8D4VQL9_9GAMM|nr:thermonuclease family protein [Methylogaea oryzae]BBL71544.1 hypothetical protein MoryE10_21500 [Methylogaea oryzae]